MSRGAIVLGVMATAVPTGLLTLHVVRGDPTYSFAGASVAGQLALLGAGWALTAAGAGFWLSRTRSRSGPLLVGAGLAWFLLEWINPGIPSSLAFTAGLVLYASCLPLVAHAVLGFPGGRRLGRRERAVGGDRVRRGPGRARAAAGALLRPGARRL